MTSYASSDLWIVTEGPTPDVRAQLFCLPYAGGGPSVYASWQAALGPEIEVCAVHLPGRQQRIAEPPFWRMSLLADAVSHAIAPQIRGPFALFGHSMGALVSFEVAERLAAQGHLAEHLFVSGERAPHLERRETHLHRMPDASLVEALRHFNGTPVDVLESPELLELVLPTIRADLAVCETYVYEGRERLGSDLTAFGGLHDPTAPWEDVQSWERQTRGSFRAEAIDGDHFFINSHPELVLGVVGEELATAARR